jgi:DNA-binding NarL/FixJ family response regulator
MSPLLPECDAREPATGREAWRVLIVDDHPIFRDGLRNLLRREPILEVVGEAESEEDAFRQFLASKIDLVTVDISLASGNGLNLIARIKQHDPSTAVLVVSMYDDGVFADLAIAAGASGYVCKHTGAAQLRAALESIRKGEVYIDPGMAEGRAYANGGSNNIIQTLKDKQLSSRELQIFTMIGQGRSTHEIAGELSIAVSTVETYRERLKSKLNLASGSELTRHALFWMMQNS